MGAIGMRCLTCGLENVEGARVCAQCRQGLPIRLRSARRWLWLGVLGVLLGVGTGYLMQLSPRLSRQKQVDALLKQALDATQHIKSVGWREEVLARIAETQALAGQEEAARSTIRQIRTPFAQSQAWMRIATAQARTAFFREASEAAWRFQAALAAAQQI